MVLLKDNSLNLIDKKKNEFTSLNKDFRHFLNPKTSFIKTHTHFNERL